MVTIKLSSSLLAATAATLVNITHGQFFSAGESTLFYSGNHALADIAEEKRQHRLNHDVFKNTMRSVIEKLNEEHEAAEYETYKERGSPYLEDGVTPIELDLKPSVDPRVPVGFGNPLAKRDFDVFLTDATSPYVLDVLDQSDETDDSKLVPMQTINLGWVLMEGKGDLYSTETKADTFTTILNQKSIKLIRIVCESCIDTHKETFYRRLTAAPSDLLDIIKKDWRSSSNTFDVDFKLYSSYDDAINNINPWTYCGGFDEPDRGFPGTCGPTEAVEDQWMNMDKGGIGQDSVGIYVQDPSAPEYTFKRTEWEVANEAYLHTNPTEAKAKGLCWNLPHRDARRECWWACKYADGTNDLGALKLCLNLRHKGQVWKTRKFSEESEALEGLEQDHKIKLTHALGLDDGLPNLGVF